MQLQARIGLVAATLLAASSLVQARLPGVAGAQADTRCQTGQSPRFHHGFAALREQVGDPMGEALTCEFPDPNGTGDVHQQTSTGLAFWRKSTNTPTFTNGHLHWALTDGGLVTWAGESVDPPPAATAQREPSAPVLASRSTSSFYLSLDGRLDPGRRYLLRITSSQEGQRLRLSTTDVTRQPITAPWEQEIVIPPDERALYAAIDSTIYAFAVVAKERSGDGGTITAEIVELPRSTTR